MARKYYDVDDLRTYIPDIPAGTMAPPAEARYGVWNLETEEWAGGFFVDDLEAADAEVALLCQGELLIVRATRDDVDDEWLNEFYELEEDV